MKFVLKINALQIHEIMCVCVCVFLWGAKACQVENCFQIRGETIA